MGRYHDVDAHTLVARMVRRLSVKRGLSQEALATDAQVDRTYVGGVERGDGKPDGGCS